MSGDPSTLLGCTTIGLEVVYKGLWAHNAECLLKLGPNTAQISMYYKFSFALGSDNSNKLGIEDGMEL
eukprot:12848083-Ditylum_brightwellii.AAC.1